MSDLRFVRDDKLLVDANGDIYYVDRAGDLVKAVPLFQPDIRQHGGGYMFIVYWDEDLQKECKAVAALVIAEAFLENPTNSRCITYKNGNPRHIPLSNIEWRVGHKRETRKKYPA